MLKLYLAHPISNSSFDDIWKYYERTITTLRGYGFKVLHPMVGSGELRNEKELKSHGYDTPISGNHAIVARDLFLVRSCDVFYCDLSKCKSFRIGCISELAVAHDRSKHTVLILEKDNPHRHAFVLEEADVVFETEAEGLDYLKKIASQEL